MIRGTRVAIAIGQMSQPLCLCYFHAVVAEQRSRHLGDCGAANLFHREVGGEGQRETRAWPPWSAKELALDASSGLCGA